MAATDALIAFLNAADGDPDVEPCITDEPHDEDTDLEAPEDSEPSLAHTNDIDQGRAQRHLRPVRYGGAEVMMDHDLEEGHDGQEPLAHPETCGGSYGAR